MAKVQWTVAMDAALGALRAKGVSWLVISRTVGVASMTARKRARELDLQISHMSSGTLTGAQVVHGERPAPRRFTRDAKRLGKIWRTG